MSTARDKEKREERRESRGIFPKKSSPLLGYPQNVVIPLGCKSKRAPARTPETQCPFFPEEASGALWAHADRDKGLGFRV